MGIYINDTDIFKSPPPTIRTVMPSLEDFADMGPLIIIAILANLEDILMEYVGSEALAMKIPPTTTTIGDVIDALGVVTQEFYPYVLSIPP